MQTDYPHNTPWQHAQQQQQYPVMPPQPPAPQPGIVWLPPVANDRSGLRVMGRLVILSALFAGFPYISANLESAQSSLVGRVEFIFVLLLLSLWLIYGISMFFQARHWSIINQRRQGAAAYGSASGVPLAEPQPFPNIEALPLPFTIKLKTNWGLVTPLFCFLIGFLFFLQLTDLCVKN